MRLNSLESTGIGGSRLALIISFRILSTNGYFLFFNFFAAWRIISYSKWVNCSFSCPRKFSSLWISCLCGEFVGSIKCRDLKWWSHDSSEIGAGTLLLCNHKLMIEQGRYQIDHLSRENRLYPLYNSNQVADEIPVSSFRM